MAQLRIQQDNGSAEAIISCIVKGSGVSARMLKPGSFKVIANLPVGMHELVVGSMHDGEITVKLKLIGATHNGNDSIEDDFNFDGQANDARVYLIAVA